MIEKELNTILSKINQYRIQHRQDYYIPKFKTTDKFYTSPSKNKTEQDFLQESDNLKFSLTERMNNICSLADSTDRSNALCQNAPISTVQRPGLIN